MLFQGNAEVDTQCGACSGKTYSDADDYSACAAMTQCAAGFGATVAGTATSDTQCQACVAAADDPDRIGSYSTSIGYVDELDIYIIFSVAKYLHREMKSYTLRPDTFTLKFNFTLSGTASLQLPSSPAQWSTSNSSLSSSSTSSAAGSTPSAGPGGHRSTSHGRASVNS